MADEILTVAEVAELLKLAEKTVYTMAQNAELPCFKVRGQWRIRCQYLGSWMAAQVATPAQPMSKRKAPKRSAHRRRVPRSSGLLPGQLNEPLRGSWKRHVGREARTAGAVCRKRVEAWLTRQGRARRDSEGWIDLMGATGATR